jgi:diacylglycerol kinase
MKNNTFLSSIRCGLNGLFIAMRSEKNFKIYAWHVLVTLIANIILHFSAIEFLIYAICVVCVFSSECINTAIEKLCDFLTEEQNEKIKVIKDIASGGVLCWGIIFYISECAMIGVHIFAP